MKEKLDFLRSSFPKNLEQLVGDTQPEFGRMNVHQMIEHMSWSFQIASGKLHYENKQSRELTEKMHRFMMSDKPFRDNTPNPNISDNPINLVTTDKNQAIQILREEIDYFIEVYKSNDALRIENPFFGMLSFSEQIHLLHKHSLHHLRQFNVIPK